MTPRLETHYRYLVLAASTGLMFMGTGTIFLIVVALKPIAQDFGWPRSVPSIAFSLQYVGAGIGGIFMGYWLDRSGMGKPALLGALMLSTGTVLGSLVDAQWQLYAIYGIMMGLFGQGTLFSPLMANIVRWFDRRRGTAVGLVAAGQSLAGIVWPPIFRYLIEYRGWRATFLYFGLVMFAVMLPLSAVMRRQPPAPTLAPAGASSATYMPGGPIARPSAAAGRTVSPQSLQNILSVAVVGCCVAMSLPIGHLVAHVSDLGHSTARAAEMLSVALAGSLFSRAVGLGAIANRFGGLASVFAFSSVQALGLALLTVVDGLVGLYLTALVFGIGYGGIVPSYPVIVREFLPPREGGRRTATIIVFGAMGMAAGGWLGGAVYDLVGSYRFAFLVGLGFNLGNLIIVGTLFRRARRGLLVPAVA